MLNLYTDPRFAHHLPGAVCFYAPPGEEDDDDEDKEKGKGKGGGGGGGGKTDAEIKKLEDDLDKWRRQSRTQEDKNKALQKEIDELKSKSDGEKSDVDKLKERLDKAETDLQKTQLDALRLRVASRKGLTEAQAKRLQGTTEEELEEDADDLLESFPAKSKDGDDDDDTGDRGRARGNGDRNGNNGRERPREALRPGAKPNEKPEENDPEKLAADVPR